MPNTEADSLSPRTHVAVGVIQNARGDILIAKRASHLHSGGLWEFPGGKVEAGETVTQALQRELQEELGITVKSARPLTRIPHDYADKRVLLDVWCVDDFSGNPCGLQNQPLQWVPVTQLACYAFPAANLRIISALLLPREMMITGEFLNRDDFSFRLGRALDQGIQCVQVRAHHCTDLEYRDLLLQAQKICEAKLSGNKRVTVIANTSIENFNNLVADGLHLTSERLMACRHRPVDKKIMFGASCHNLVEIRQAEKLNADYITLGPVFKTPSHPDALPLGLEQFSRLAQNTVIPAFALGGITADSRFSIINSGGFGIASITLRWG